MDSETKAIRILLWLLSGVLMVASAANMWGLWPAVFTASAVLFVSILVGIRE